jgi:DNA-binding IclR family transcriptional regulator
MAIPGAAHGLATEQLQTLRRGLAVLEALAARPHGATSKELSQALGLHLSTTYRLLNTLLASGYATRNDEGLFRLGARVAFLNHGYLAAASPPPGVVPFVHALQLATGETVMFTHLEGDNVVAVAVASGSRPGSIPPGYIGLAGPAHSAAAGRALLALLPPAQIEAYVARQIAAPAVLFPVTNPHALLRDLEQIRRDGYALDRGEDNPVACCVAAAVTGPNGVVGSISVLGPCSRVRREEAALIPTVLEVARAIAALLKTPTRDATADLEREEAAQATIEAALATLAATMSRVG